eukprot:2118809-Pleurochrysis_carterae.AAC.1
MPPSQHPSLCGAFAPLAHCPQPSWATSADTILSLTFLKSHFTTQFNEFFQGYAVPEMHLPVDIALVAIAGWVAHARCGQIPDLVRFPLGHHCGMIITTTRMLMMI